ncbi:insulinase family protein [Gilvimarinus chinensis]|uniref:insulinase family protein n=1 Tax=Gilvimarinus chinensis TaxID=396005 RepID=UPI00036C260C|nr:insulinase family protein [Gilvimarinus chinensis]
MSVFNNLQSAAIYKTVLLSFISIIAACTPTDVQPPNNNAPLSGDNVIRKSPNDTREYRVLSLPNALQVVLVSDSTIEVSGASLSVGVGSYQNPEEIPGLAHYLEHMLFLGTEKYPEPNSFQTFVQQNAGFSNAYTASTHTNYFFQIGEGAFDEALDRYSDYFKAPTFDRQYSDKERHAVNSEWSMGREQDGRIINRLRGITADPKHPAYRMSVGNLETLVDQPDMPLYETMLNFYQRYYSANNMKLVLFGKQPLDELQALAEKHFSTIENNNIEAPQVKQKGLTKSVLGQHIFYQPQKPTRQLVIEFSLNDNTDQWPFKPNRYLANLISSEEPGTAAEILRKKGWVDDFTASISPDYYGSDGMFMVNVGLTESGLSHQDDIIATVFAYLNEISRNGVDESYFREYKAMVEKQFADLQMPNPLNQAIGFSSSMFETPVEHLIDLHYVYEKFDPEAINQVLQQLRPQNARIWHIHPQAEVDTDIPFYAGQYKTKKFTKEELDKWQKKASAMKLELPEENDLFSSVNATVVEPTIEKPVLVTEDKGIEAWLAHSMHHQSEHGYLQVMFNTDLPQLSAENRVMSDLINRIFSLQTTALRDKAGRAGIGIGIERPRDNHALTLSGYSEKHPLLYERLLKRWVEMEVEPQDFTIAMEGYRDWLDGRAKADPNRQLFTELDRLMSTPSWTDAELREASEAITLDKINQYQKELLSKNRIRLFAFGNYNEAMVNEFVAITESQLPDAWQKRDRYLGRYHTPEVGQEQNLSSTTLHSDNALLRAYYSPVDELNTGAQLLLLNSVFHQAFYNKLRTEDQVGYIVGSSIDRIGDYWGFILYAQTTNTELADLTQRFTEFVNAYPEQLAAIEPSVFETLRDSVIAQINQPPGNFFDDYPRFLNDFYRGNNQFDSREKLTAAIAATDKSQVQALYQSLILSAEAETVTISLSGKE